MMILEAAYSERQTKMERVQDMMLPVLVEVSTAAMVVKSQETT